MTQEEKQLLLIDLCTRLPYRVKVKLHGEICTVLGYVDDFIILTSDTPIGQQTNIVNVKPYLRPMSSMTKEEENEYKMFIDYSYNDFTSESFPCVYVDKINDYLDWLNAHQFDYRGLIPMGLALPATEGMYNI